MWSNSDMEQGGGGGKISLKFCVHHEWMTCYPKVTATDEVIKTTFNRNTKLRNYIHLSITQCWVVQSFNKTLTTFIRLKQCHKLHKHKFKPCHNTNKSPHFR